MEYGANDYKAIIREAQGWDDYGAVQRKLASLERRLDALVAASLAAAAALPTDAPERSALHGALRAVRGGVGP